MDRKAALKEEADAKMEQSRETMKEYAPVQRDAVQEEDPVPPTRLKIAEGVELLLRCVEIFESYGHEDMKKRAEMRLERGKWSLEKQDRAHELIAEALAVSKQYKRETGIQYDPTPGYPYRGAFFRCVCVRMLVACVGAFMHTA